MSTLPPNQPNDICLQVDDLLDAYAFDALEPDEQALVDAHLTDCPQQRHRLAELLEVSDQLALALPATSPPPGVWDRLMTETAPAVPSVAPAAVITPFPDAPAPARAGRAPAPRSNVVTMNRWVAWAGGVAAALLLASTVALGAALQREDEGDEPTGADPLVAMVARGGEVVPLSTQPEVPEMPEMGQGSIVVAPGMEPAVVVDHWTPSSEELKYIVWMAAANGDGTTVLGEIEVDENGNGILILNGVTTFEGYDVFGISIQTTPDAGLTDVLLGAPPDQAG